MKASALKTAFALAASLAGSAPGFAANIYGAGAPNPAISRLANDYRAATRNTVNYQAVGGTGAIPQVKSGIVSFAVSDTPLSSADLQSNGLMQFPAFVNGVVPVVNVPGVAADKLVLDGPTLAKIYTGAIKQWNDPEIKRLNPNLTLPDTKIVPIVRSDASGANLAFTGYLSQTSPDWKAGTAATINLTTTASAKGNEGVGPRVQQTGGAIGYVDYAFAKANHLVTVKLVNKNGAAIAPSATAFQSAAASADWAGAQDFNANLANQPGANSWPMAAAVFALVPRQTGKPASEVEALKFFSWAFGSDAKGVSDSDYVPLPDKAVAAVKRAWQDGLPYAANIDQAAPVAPNP